MIDDTDSLDAVVDRMVMALDPAELALAAGYQLDDWQQRAVRSTAKRQIYLASRQAGKSLTLSVKALHQALFVPESKILLVSRTQRQAGELFRSMLALYRALGRPVLPSQETQLQLELENHSRIIALPADPDTIRGYSGISLLELDEAAFMSDDTYEAVKPSLAVSNGVLVCSSTPFGRRGFFHQAWVSDEAWERYEVPAGRVARISAEFLAEQRRNMAPSVFESEYQCQFIDNQSLVFSLDAFDASLVQPEPEEERQRPWDQSQSQHHNTNLLEKYPALKLLQQQKAG